MVGVGFPGSYSASPAAPFQPLATLGKPTGFGDTEVPMELAQRTNPQCSTLSEPGARVHPPETLTALFHRHPPCITPLGIGGCSTSLLQNGGPPGSRARDLTLQTCRSLQLREVTHFPPGAPGRSRTPHLVSGKDGVQCRPWDDAP